MKNNTFDNASFINDCFTYILFNLNLVFLEQTFNKKIDRDYVQTLWNYLIPNELYVYICRNDSFVTLNKLKLKFQNANKVVINFILEDNNKFCCSRNVLRRTPYYFNTSILYSTLSPKYFCRIDDYGVKSKLAFEVAHAGSQNQQENLRFVQLQQTPTLVANVKQEPVEE